MKTLYSVLLIASLIALSSVVTYSAEAAGIPKGAISITGQWATTDLPKGTMDNGFLKASTGNTPSYSTISAGDVPDLSSTYAKLNGGRVPNSLLPDAVVRTNQTNTFGAYAQTFASIILGGDLNIGPNALTNSGHRVLMPSNSGTVLLTNGSLSSLTGTLGSSVGVTTLSKSGHVSTFPSNTGTIAHLNSTFSGATIDASTNTISNLADANVKTGAAIAWSKVSKSGSSIHDLANVTSTGCADGQILSVSGTTWRCTDRPFIPVLLQSDVTATSTTGVTVFTIPLVASSNNVIDGTLLEFTASATVGVRAGAYFDTSGQAGVCQITTPETTTTAPVDNLVLTTSNLNTGSAAMAAANVPLPAVVDCTITTTATPGNLIITVAADSAATVKVLAGSYYTIVSK